MSGPRFPSFYDGYNAEMYHAMSRREIRENYCQPRLSRNPHRAESEDTFRTPSTSASRQDQASSTPSTLSRASPLPDFNSPIKTQQRTTEASPVRSSLTKSLSSESKSEIYLSKSEKPNKATSTSRRKSKSWESITPKNCAAKKKFFEARSKLKASFLSVWFGSKPTYFPSSRSPSRLSKLRNLFLDFARRHKVKKEDNNQQELSDFPQSSPSQDSNSSKNKTKDTSDSESRNKTNSILTTTATTTSTTITTTSSTTTPTTTTTATSTNKKYTPANVEDIQDSKDSKTKQLIPSDDAAHGLSTAYYEDQPQLSHYDRTEQVQCNAKRRIKRRVPDLEHLYPHLKNAPLQQESSLQVQNRHDKYVEPKITVPAENVINDCVVLNDYSKKKSPLTYCSYSEGTQHNARGQPRQGQDGSPPNHAVTRQNLQQHSIESDEKEVLPSSYNNSEKDNEQIVQHQFEEKRSDQRAFFLVYTPYNQANPEQIKEHSFEQSPHGAIRRQPLQQPQSKSEKKEEQKTRRLQYDARSHEQSQSKYFDNLKQYRSKVEKIEDNKVRVVNLEPENNNDLEEHGCNELRHQRLQQERCKQHKQIQLAAEIHEEKTESKQQHSVESDQSRPDIKQLQNTPQPTASKKRILPKTSEILKFQSRKSKQNKKEYTSQVAKHDQLPQQQLPKNSVKQLQGQRQQIKHKQSEEQGRVQWFDDPSVYAQKFFWRQKYSYELELDSPHHFVELEVENIHLEESPEPPPEYPNEYLETLHQEDLPQEDINVTEFSDFRDQRFSEHRMGRMGSLEDHERKVIIEFCHLLEKSKQLFNGLRELPQYGHKQWHSYFGRTFDVYTKLWKFQQQHRAVLDNKYGLKRWQIGEIASKIGQLYYHFYLRTSETAYLNEAFSFYSAIRGRSYYTKASKEDKCELMVKKLRYYARYIVVCLLIKKVKLVRELIKELDRQIIEYGNTYDPDDQAEWNIVVEEVKAFLQAEPVVSVIHPDNYTVILSHRLSSITTPLVERTSQMNLSLQEVLIVGSSSQQVKFSELTMDMFRMLHTLEREHNVEVQQMYDDSPRQRFNLTPSTLNTKGYNLEMSAPRCENPHKYLLFKPSPSQILVYLASGCNDLPPNGALLLYISADGQIVQSSKHPEDGYDIGGLITTSKTDFYRDSNKEKGSQSKYKEGQCLHPGDLYPFTRRPLFIIIDSDNSYVFNNMPRHFGQPLVVLMSPIELPSSLYVSERRHQGNLFTLFLHAPLTAFCHCCDIHTIPLVHWDRAQSYIDAFIGEALQLLMRSRIDMMILCFMNDDFLRALMLRFIFCEVVLRMHRAFRARTHLTRCSPPLPDDLLEHPALTHIVMDLAAHLQVRGNFHDPSATAVGGPADDRRPPKE